jgi:hypothetical protein
VETWFLEESRLDKLCCLEFALLISALITPIKVEMHPVISPARRVTHINMGLHSEICRDYTSTTTSLQILMSKAHPENI